jgi:hypothetical protein
VKIDHDDSVRETSKSGVKFAAANPSCAPTHRGTAKVAAATETKIRVQ